MSVRHEEDKGYIISIDTPKQFAELIEKGQLGLESLDLGMFHILLNFQFVDGKAERCKKHGNNDYNRVHGLGAYRPKEEKVKTAATAEELLSGPLEGQKPAEAESPQGSV